ncbi:MAG: SGNH/GDSL hydrolase family protein [Candidatus Tyrphobacter sp.]
MRVPSIIKTLAILAAAMLAACSTRGGSAIPPTGTQPSSGAGVTQTIVGLGDSLTAGEQSSGVLGSATVPLPDPTTLFSPIGAIGIVPPTQENGFFSVLYSAAKGSTWAAQANPTSSVLPLIAGPGIGNQILPANPAYTGGIPFATLPGRSSCDAFNQSAYSYASVVGSVRMNPTATTYDLGIPSLTLHEAIAMYQPTTTSCVAIYPTPANAAQAEIDALQSLVSGESENFYPVMEKYSPPGSEVTPLQAAASLHPTLTTVWLGANDLLRYAFSGGVAPGLDTTTAQVKSDMTTIIATLQHAGSDVIVADLPNIIQTPQFAIVGIPPGGQAQCAIQTWLPCVLADVGYSWTNAEAATNVLISTYSFLAPSGTNYAYLNESGAVYILGGGTLTAAQNGTYFLTAAFGVQVQSVNAAINAGIQAAASANHAAYVPIDQIFAGIYSGSGTYFNEAASINPGICCTLAFGGGLLSLDGLHPSDTGYALIASVFAQTANTAFGTSIPAINPAGAYDGLGGIYAPYPDPYAQH